MASSEAPAHRHPRLPGGAAARRDRPGGGVRGRRRARRRRRLHGRGGRQGPRARSRPAAAATRWSPKTTTARCRGPIDTLVVAGGFGVAEAENDADLIRWIRSAARRSRRVTSVCSGSFLLAAGRSARGQDRHHPLGLDRRAGPPPPRAQGRSQADLRPRRGRLDVGGRHLRHGPLPGAGGGGPGARDRAGGRSLAGALPPAARRPGPVQLPSVVAARRAPAAPRAPVVDRRQPRRRPASRVARRAGRDEPAQLRPLLPARDRDDTRRPTSRCFEWSGPVSCSRKPRIPSSSSPPSCGFGTPETMRRAFARRVGSSPAEYRARFRRNPTPVA